MKYVGVVFKSGKESNSFGGKIYYYKTNLDLNRGAIYSIKSEEYTYNNPIKIASISKKAPDANIEYREITEAKVIEYLPRAVPEWITPKNVYFNPDDGGVTCVIWQDGEKTIVRCAEDEIFDFEKGFTVAIATRLYNKGQFNKYLKKFVAPVEKEYYNNMSEELKNITIFTEPVRTNNF